MWLAPNVMTFVGWVLTVAIFLVLSYYDPYIVAGGSRNDLHKHYHIPQWIWIYIAFAHFAAHTLDGCDGKQARRTKSRWIHVRLDYFGRPANNKAMSRGINVGCVVGGGTIQTCFSRSPNEFSRSQNINCLNRCDFYTRTTKYFRFNRTR